MHPVETTSRFPTKEDADRYASDFLAVFPPGGYGSRAEVTYDAHALEWIVKTFRWSSCD